MGNTLRGARILEVGRAADEGRRQLATVTEETLSEDPCLTDPNLVPVNRQTDGGGPVTHTVHGSGPTLGVCLAQRPAQNRSPP